MASKQYNKQFFMCPPSETHIPTHRGEKKQAYEHSTEVFDLFRWANHGAQRFRGFGGHYTEPKSYERTIEVNRLFRWKFGGAKSF